MVEFDPTEIWEIDGKLGFRQEKHDFTRKACISSTKKCNNPTCLIQ
jgi:hypothetical protein